MIRLKIKNELRQNIDFFYLYEGKPKGCTIPGRSTREIMCDEIPPEVQELASKKRRQFVILEQEDIGLEHDKAVSEADAAKEQSDRIASSSARRSEGSVESKKITGG
jgi:hypothetical protein